MTADAPGADTTVAVLAIVAVLAREAHPGATLRAVAPDDDLERDLGFDSLERAELLRRIEDAFDVRLPPGSLVDARSARDLARGVAAGTRGERAPRLPAIEVPGPADAAASEGAATLVDMLAWHAARHPSRTHLTLVVETEAGPAARTLTYGALHDEALLVAAGLDAAGIVAGEAVAIMLPTSLDFFIGFFGVLFAGAVPVPIYPPATRSQLEEHFRRQSKIVDNALAVALITFPEARGVARLLLAATPSLRQILSVPALRSNSAHTGDRPDPLGPANELSPAMARSGRHRAAAADTAFLQYTSGSTGQPKGVVLSHANVLASIRAMGRALGVRNTDVFVSWLPLYHDMGLIGAWLGSLHYAVPLVVMPPTDFLARPERWLQAIHRYRGTLSAGPNFAYEFCASRIDERALAGLDLSSWRAAFNGAEPVSPDTIRRFNERFARYGFDPNAQLPVYGLAECTLGLSFPPPGRGVRIDRVDRLALAATGVATKARDDDPRPLQVVACGNALPGHEARIVDAGGRELPERHEGSVEFRGPAATSGYFRNPEATRDLRHGDWWVTGDLGYVAGGELYLTGRAKDLIIRGGQHVHPQEAEAVIGEIPGIRRGCVTVFGVSEAAGGSEKVVVVAETRETDPGRLAALRATIGAQCLALWSAPVDDIVLARPHTVLKTSSGKIRRAACADLYRRGLLRASPVRVWPQLLRLLAVGAGLALRRSLRHAGDLLFAVYAWGLFVVGATTTLPIVAVLPRPAWRRRIVAWLARNLIRLSGLSLRVRGAENLRRDGPIIIVANHASYLDGIVLQATLPDYCTFVAKRELAANVVLRFVLSRLGTRFVERFDVAGSVESAGELEDAARSGASLVFFPEGTLRREAGLLPFHAGAFVAAAITGAPVVPVTLCGTRSVLRDGQWRPQRAPIDIVVGAPIIPAGKDWAAAMALRDQARAAILAVGGEPDHGAML